MNDATTTTAQYLKISIKRQQAGKPQIIYNELSTSYNEFFKTCNNLDIQYLFKYWIDDDGDKVEITDDISYQMFIKLSKKKLILADNGDDEDDKVENFTKKDQILKKDVRTKTSKLKGTKANNSSSYKHYKKPVHEGVVCDNCNVHPIVGFRYKCFSCPNYDLCSRCERKKKHYHHKMIRYNEPAKHASLFEELSMNSLNNKDSKQGNDCNVRKSIRNGANNAFHNLFEMMEGMANDDSLNNTDNSLIINNKKKVCFEEKNYNSNNNSDSDSTDTDNTEIDSEDIEKNKKQVNYFDIDASNVTSNNLNNSSEKKENTMNHSTNIFPDDGSNRFIDTKIKAGVQALGSFGNIFHNFLAPLKTPIQQQEEQQKQTQIQQQQQELTVTQNQEQLHKPENSEKLPTTPISQDVEEQNINQIKVNSNKNIEVGTLIDFDLTSMDGAVGGVNSQNAGYRELSPDDIGWTMIEKTLGTSRNKSIAFEKKSDTSEELGNKSNHAQNKKSTDLPNPIEKQTENNIVYHKNTNINNSVLAMISMGFSNEGNSLVQLLESVKGDICQALDVIQKNAK